MKKIFFLVSLLLTLAFGLGISSASSYIFLSADLNITDPLVGAQGSNVDPGNQQFFTNILQDGSNVVVLESSYALFAQSVNSFYSTLPGKTSTLVTGTITDAQLVGVDLFVSPDPIDSFTANEITTFENLLAQGGSIFFIGDHAGAISTNQIINDALTSLNSGMSIMPNSSFDIAAWHTAVGPQIATDSFTTSIQTLTYNAASQVDGGTYLFFGSEGQPFVTYNTCNPVPIPGAIWLLGSGLFGLVTIRRRKAKA